MYNTMLPAIVIFGILFAICVIGLLRANAASRFDASNARSHRPLGAHGDTVQYQDEIRR
jgi:hypothetical protein